MANGPAPSESGPSPEAVKAYADRMDTSQNENKGLNLRMRLQEKRLEARREEEERSKLMDELQADLSLAETSEEMEVISKTVIELTESPEDFKEIILEARAKFADSTKLRSRYSTFREYAESKEGRKSILMLGLDHIVERREIVIGTKLRVANEEAGEDLDEAAEKRQQDEILRYIDTYKKDFEKHYDTDDKDPKKVQLKKRFFKLKGLAHLDDEQKEELFDAIGMDVFVEKVAKERYGAAHDGMTTFMLKAIEEDWDLADPKVFETWMEIVEEEIKKHAKGAIQEAVERKELEISYQYEGPPPTDLETPHHVAHYAGVNIVGKASDGAYIVKYPNSPYQTRMYIEKKEDQKDFNNARFGFEDMFADPGKPKILYCEKKGLRANANRIFMDFIMNRKLQRENIGPDESVNTYLKDEKMMRMASKVLGKDLNDVVVTTPERRNILENMLAVVMKDERPDEEGEEDKSFNTFKKRVREIGIALEDPSKAALMRKELAKPAGSAWTLSKLLKKIELPDDEEV